MSRASLPLLATVVLICACCVSMFAASIANGQPVGDLVIGTGGDTSGRERVGGVIGLLGRLHPLSVHFPVALIIVAGLAEALCMWTHNDAFGFAARLMLYIVSVLAVISVLLGFAAASGKTLSPDLSFHFGLHRVMGIVTAGLALLTTGLAEGAKKRGDPWRLRLYRAMLAVTMITVAFAAHSGATLVFGRGYLSIF